MASPSLRASHNIGFVTMPAIHCHCGAKYRFTKEHTGRKAKCGKCGRIIVLKAEVKPRVPASEIPVVATIDPGYDEALAKSRAITESPPDRIPNDAPAAPLVRKPFWARRVSILLIVFLTLLWMLLGSRDFFAILIGLGFIAIGPILLRLGVRIVCKFTPPFPKALYTMFVVSVANTPIALIIFAGSHRSLESVVGAFILMLPIGLFVEAVIAGRMIKYPGGESIGFVKALFGSLVLILPPIALLAVLAMIVFVAQ